MDGKATGFQGALIDLWGTLIPTGTSTRRSVHLGAMAECLGVEPTRFERDWTASLPQRCVGAFGTLEETVAHVARRVGGSPTEGSIRRAVEIRLEFSRETMAAGSVLLPALDALRNAGLRLALVSDASEETPRLWPTIPLGARFEAAVFSCRTGFCKPDPRAYRQALAQLHLPPEVCAYVGDGGSRELTGARSVGLTAFQYRCPGQAEHPEYRYDPEPSWSGPRLADLTELLSGPFAGRASD